MIAVISMYAARLLLKQILDAHLSRICTSVGGEQRELWMGNVGWARTATGKSG